MNEPQRVYCHNCGEKLDRSAVLKAAEKVAKKSASKPKGLPKQKVPLFQVFIAPLLSLILLGAITASLICMLTPPEEFPYEVPESLLLDPPNLKISFENVLASGGGRKFGITSDQINAYLLSRIGIRSAPGFVFFVTWDRAATELNRDSASLYIIRRVVFGSKEPKKHELAQHFPLVVRADFEVQKMEDEPGIGVRATGGQIGRLRLPGLVMDFLKQFLFGELAKVMSEEILDLGKMKSIKISQGVLEIESPGVGN